MNPFWTQVVAQTMLRKKKKSGEQKPRYTRRELAQGYREFRIVSIRGIKDVILISLGIFSAAFGLESFLIPNHFFDGGATGISLLAAQFSTVPLPLLLVLINIPFVFLGFQVINNEFAVKTAIAISGLALVVNFVHMPEVTNDKLLVAVFGGFFLGAGIGLSVRGGAVIDGTEVLAIFLSRKVHTTIGDIIMVINILIFSAVAYLINIETALYSMITYLSATKTLDFVVEGIEEYTGVTIVSPRAMEIRNMIVDELGRGVTIYKGESGFGKTGVTGNTDIIYTVITRLEVHRLNTELEKIDPKAFVVMSTVKDTKGGMIKKRALKH